MTASNCLKRIYSKLITYENSPPFRKRVLISQREVRNFEDIIVKRYTDIIEMARKEAIQVISYIGQENYYVQSENHLD